MKKYNYYFVIEFFLIIIAIVYNVNLYNFNKKLNDNLGENTSLIILSFKMFSFEDGKAFNYLFGAILIILFASIIIASGWIKYFKYNISELLLINIICTFFNITIIIFTLVLINNPILWGFLVLCGVGSYIFFIMGV